jgi:signal peptidase I
MSEETTAPSGAAGAGQTGEVHVVVEQRTRRGCCLARVATAFVTVVVVFILLANTVAPYRVRGHGMEPTVRDNQTVLVHTVRFLTLTFLPGRGDVVMYHPNDHPSDTIIGRVIAIPGDTVQVTPDTVIVNGQTLTEQYIATAPAGQPENQETVPATRLGDGRYFILGDNRPGTNADDSRHFGPVSFDRIVGVEWIIL